MNYIKELNALFDFCILNRLSKSEIILLRVLYDVNNKNDWAEWFEADNKTVSRLTGGYSREAINEARNKLKQRGRLDFKDGKKNVKAPQYKLISFNKAVVSDIPVDVQVDIPVDVQVDVQVDPLSKQNKTKQKELIEHSFETVWAAYPNKKGKGHVSYTQKAKLCKIGVEKLLVCIERYEKDKEEWQKHQYGSTFFNSGYIDYLDENYTVTTSPYQEGAIDEEGRTHVNGRWMFL